MPQDPLRTMHVCAKFPGNPSNSQLDFAFPKATLQAWLKIQ